MTASQNITVKMKKNNQKLVDLLIKYFYHAVVKLFTEKIKTER